MSDWIQKPFWHLHIFTPKFVDLYINNMLRIEVHESSGRVYNPLRHLHIFQFSYWNDHLYYFGGIMYIISNTNLITWKTNEEEVMKMIFIEDKLLSRLQVDCNYLITWILFSILLTLIKLEYFLGCSEAVGWRRIRGWRSEGKITPISLICAGGCIFKPLPALRAAMVTSS